MSNHFDSLLMNDVLLLLEKQLFFAEIGEERTLSFVQDALALSRYYDGNPGEALSGVGQRLGICFYCWERGTELRHGICRDCRDADSIGIEPDDADTNTPRNAALSYGFIRKETIRDLLRFLPDTLTKDLDSGSLRELPGRCVSWDLRDIVVDSPWSVDCLPGRRRRHGTPVLMIEVLSHPYPRVVQRLRRYASMLSEQLKHSRGVEEPPPFIIPVLLYNGLPAWTPPPKTEGPYRFEYTFVDVRRLHPDTKQSYEFLAALSSPEAARDIRQLLRFR